MRRIRSGCCALVASGHAAAPPMSVMNSRRYPEAEDRYLTGSNWRIGSNRRCPLRVISGHRITSGLPPKADMVPCNYE
jgi:hypothetical protein